MYLLTLFIPLLTFLLFATCANYLGTSGVRIIALINAWVLPINACLILYEVVYMDCPTFITLGDWITVHDVGVEFGFVFDNLTVVLVFLISFVSTIVITYSLGYMSHDPHLVRFISYLYLFSFFMLLFVTSNNYIQLFLGWEGVGLVSYLLINFFFTRVQANKAALKAIFVNRFGDFAMFLGILAILTHFKSSEFNVCFVVKATTTLLNDGSLFFYNDTNFIHTFIAFSLLIAAVGKSAQVPLHIWLPDATEGPTPVSALLHAATMVTAGVFLLLRNGIFYESSVSVTFILVLLSSLTAVLGASIAAFQTDLKKIIAYSTCSQLGYMLMSFSNCCNDISLYHLLNHGFFKALLFLSAGCIIHALNNEQDVRRMGGLLVYLPCSYQYILLGSLSLMGIPFLSGFFSKDAILESAFSSYSNIGLISFTAGILSAYFTSFYSARLILSVFISPTSSSKATVQEVHEAEGILFWPLLFLALGSITSGFIFKDLMIGLGSYFAYIPTDSNTWYKPFLGSEFIPGSIKLLPFFVTLCGTLHAYHMERILSSDRDKILSHFFLLKVYRFFNLKWFFDIIYNHYIIVSFLEFCYHVVLKYIDRGLFEHVGPSGIETAFFVAYSHFKQLYSGMVTAYLLFIVANIVLMLSCIFLGLFIFYKLFLILIWLYLVLLITTLTKQ
jgi:NADH-ubiquinone oxidoreductase chain 5